MNTEIKCKEIFTPYVARRLLKMGNKVVDIKPYKGNRDKTVFVFEVNDKFIEDMAVATKHE